MTDYIITKIKKDNQPDWTSTTTSGVVFAWYRDFDDKAPYKMGGSE